MQPDYIPPSIMSNDKGKKIGIMNMTMEDIVECKKQSAPIPALKHISQLKGFQFAININRANSDLVGKYRKQVDSLIEAIFCCEATILLVDDPRNLSELLNLANYHSLRQLSTSPMNQFYLFVNPWEYYIALGCWIVHSHNEAKEEYRTHQDSITAITELSLSHKMVEVSMI